MQPVGYLDQNYAYIIGHRQQQLLEVLCLCRSAVTENTTGYFGQPVYNLGDLRAEYVFYVFYGIIRIFYHIVQQGGTNGCRTKTYFVAYNLCHSEGVHNVRFARTAFDALMRLIGKVECLCYDFNTLAVFGCQVVV